MKAKILALLIVLTLLIGIISVTIPLMMVRADPTVWNVYPGAGTPIQDAINAAIPDDTIIVHPGTYPEAIVINKALNVTGYGADTTFIDGSGVALSSAGLVKITATSGNVIFSGFTVSNAEPVGSKFVRIEILTQSSLAGPTYTVSHNKIYGTNNPDEAEDYGFYASYGKENVIFTHNLVSWTGANNMVLECHTGTTEISYNTLDAGVWGCDPIYFMTYDSIDVTTLQNVSYNTFDLGTGGPFDFDHRATGVSFNTPGPAWGLGEAKFTNMVIAGNTINNLESNRRGIGFWNGGTGDNLKSPIVTGNTINGVGAIDSWGIDFVGGPASDALIAHNNIEETDIGILLRTSGAAPSAKINYNNIAGNSIGMDWTLGPSPADARFNWWGSPSGPTSPSNPGGTGDDVSGNVDFEPWLIEPYPPAIQEPLLYVDPATVEYLTPSYGETFTINVKIENVTNLFGYEFKLYWDTTLLDLINVQTIWPPWPHYFAAKNDTNEALGMYWVSLVILGIPAFTGSTTLAKLKFRITHDPLYPETKTCKLDLAETMLTAPGGIVIYHMTHDGTYSIYSVEPKITIKSFPLKVRALGETVCFDIFINDVVDLYQFSFKLGYDTTMLDVVSVDFGFLDSPFVPYYEIHEDMGYVYVWAWSVDPATPANGTGVLVSITMKATKASIWPDPPLTCSLHLYETQLKTKEYIQLLHTTVDGVYIYEPKPGDLNADGKVDLVDLRLVAAYYYPSYNRIADLNRDGYVNLIDLTIVATYYEEY